VLLLPIALTRLSTAEIALWYFFRIITDLRPIIDMGFGPTFVRQIAYAYGGSKEYEKPIQNISDGDNPKSNLDLVERTFFTMEAVYGRLTIIFFSSLAVLGSIAVIRPIRQIDNQITGWLAWGVVILGSAFFLRGNSYTSFLQGSNNIPLYRRWEALFLLAAIPSSIVVLLLGGGLLGLVITEQFWIFVAVLRNRRLTASIIPFNLNQTIKEKYSKDIFKSIWPRAWRSGIGVIMSYGVMQFSGLIYSQFGDTSSVAAYLLSLRFAQNISTFSRVPFYSRLPQMATLYARNKQDQLISIAQRGMNYSHWLFSLGFIGFGISAPYLLIIINSNTSFVPQSLWALMGLGFFAERFGAMHLQLYTLTNKVVWHIANGISGAIAVVVALLSLSSLGVYAFPIGYSLGNIGFYTWYSAKLAYSTFSIKSWDFETKTSLIPLTLFLIYLVFTILNH